MALDPATVAALRTHRKRQVIEKLALGPGYRDDGFVFAREDGHPLHRDTISKWFADAVEPLDVPGITLHGLRHTWASCESRPFAAAF